MTDLVGGRGLRYSDLDRVCVLVMLVEIPYTKGSSSLSPPLQCMYNIYVLCSMSVGAVVGGVRVGGSEGVLMQ